MNEINLKPCPICGGRPSWDDDTVEVSAAVIFCTACGATTREHTPHIYAAYEWNAGLIFRKENGYGATCARVIIVSRHAGTIEWLRERGITGEVIAHVSDPSQVTGKIVVGNLPLHLAAQAFAVAAIDMPNLPAEKRGQDLTPNEMDEFGARLSVYRVTRG